MASLEEFRDALVTIYNADAAVRTLCGGRTTLNLAPRGAQTREENLPLLTYIVITSPKKRGMKGSRIVLIQFEAWAKDDVVGVFATLEGLLDRAEALFNGPGLAGESVDVSRNPILSRDDVEPVDAIRGLRMDMLFDLTL